jgi:hypothetical protein
MKEQITGLFTKIHLKNNFKLLVFFCVLLILKSCIKDCPDEVKTTKKTYSISEVVKKTFPYNFKDTQVWINVNTNDTLHYILKDSLSTYDTSYSTSLEGCKENNYVYTESLAYNLICTENSLFNYNHIYKSYLGLGFDEKVKFMNVVYTEFGGDLIDIYNYGIIFKSVYVSEYFAENKSFGILRITANKKKLYRIK